MNEKTTKWRLYSRLYLLAALALMSLIGAVKFFDIARLDREVMFNTGIDVLGLFICVALFYGCMDEESLEIDDSTRWLMAMIFLLGICFFKNN